MYLLLNHGEEGNLRTQKGGPVLLLTVEHGHDLNAQLLLEIRADPATAARSAGRRGRALLHVVCSRCCESVVASLLNRGTLEVTLCDEAGETPLFAALTIGHLPNAKVLLEHGADVKVGKRWEGNHERCKCSCFMVPTRMSRPNSADAPAQRTQRRLSSRSEDAMRQTREDVFPGPIGVFGRAWCYAALATFVLGLANQNPTE